MSTILDALRKLQGDREGLAAPPRRDLRSSVLDSGPPRPVRAPRRESSVRPLVAALAGGAVVAGGLGAFVLWDGGAADSFERDASALEMPSDETSMAQVEVPSMPPPEPAPPPRAPEPLVNLAAPPEPPPESREARYAAFQPPPQSEPEPASGQPLFQAPETFAPVNQRARPRVEDEAHGEMQATYPSQQQGTFAPQQPYEPPQIVTREASRKPTRPAELESALERARQRLARSESPAPRPRERREEPPPAREPERPAAEEPREGAGVGIEFPDVQVQSVLWHPDPLRRQATVLLDGQLTTDAREGDLIAGVLVDRITPGSVEFRMGQERKRVDMTP